MKLSNKFYCLLALSSLTACGGSSVKETLGIGYKAPDEFRVVSRPPLSVPPQFNLRPPATGAYSPTVASADKQARSIVTGKDYADDNNFELSDSTNVDTAVTPVELEDLPSPTGEKKGKKEIAKNTKISSDDSKSGFFQNIGVNKADPKVREELVQQKIAAEEKKEEESWWGIFSSPTEKKETLVDAKKEAERIKDNKAAGKSITEGETPEVKDKDRGLIGKIFGW